MAENQENTEQQDEPIEPAEQVESEEKLQCTVTIDDSGPWKKKITVEIPRAEIDKELDKEYGELRKTADVPGFRKGRAPRRLVEKRFGTEVTDQAKLRLIAQAFEQVDKDHDFEILGEPDFDPKKIEIPETGDLKFDYEIEVKPQFELPELEGVRIEKAIFEITPERVEEALQRLQRRYGRSEEITDGAAQDNDVVYADVTMKVEGIDEPETRDNIPIRVGEAAVMGVLVEDMGTVLAGATVGQTRTCSAEVPDTHAKEEYRGKKADFTIAIKEIRRLIPAELNQELFDKIGVSDENELKTRIEESLEDQADHEVRNQMIQQVRSYLNDNIVFELPAGVAARHAGRVLQRRYYELLQQGIPQDQINENIDKLQAASSAQSAQELKMSFIMEKVADKLDIEVSGAEVNGQIAQMASAYQRRPERLREEMAREGRLDSLKESLREERAIDRILEMAQIVDAPAVQEKPAKKSSKKTTKKSDEKSEEKSEEEDHSQSAGKSDQTDPTGENPKTSKKPARKEVKRKPPSSDKEDK